MDDEKIKKASCQQWLKNHSCPSGQQRFLAGTLPKIKPKKII